MHGMLTCRANWMNFRTSVSKGNSIVVIAVIVFAAAAFLAFRVGAERCIAVCAVILQIVCCCRSFKTVEGRPHLVAGVDKHVMK